MTAPYDPPELSQLIPHLTRCSIDDDEQRALYEAARAGHQLPLGVRRWKELAHYEYAWKHMTFDEIRTATTPLRTRILDGLECPGCGHQVAPCGAGPLPCDGCGHVFVVAG